MKSLCSPAGLPALPAGSVSVRGSCLAGASRPISPGSHSRDQPPALAGPPIFPPMSHRNVSVPCSQGLFLCRQNGSPLPRPLPLGGGSNPVERQMLSETEFPTLKARMGLKLGPGWQIGRELFIEEGQWDPLSHRNALLLPSPGLSAPPPSSTAGRAAALALSLHCPQTDTSPSS